MRKRARAATLLTTLMFIGLGLTLVLVFSGASLMQVHRSEGMARNMRAARAAESVLALATERMLTEPDFADSETNFLQWEDGTSQARLSFDEEQADDWSIPVSLSNRDGSAAREGWRGVRIPTRAVHLIAVGESGGRRKTIDLVLAVPEFPFALASSGAIESRGGLVVGGFRGEDASELDLEALAPADLFSNGAHESIDLQGEVSVSGDVKAVGEITFGEEVRVHGVVEPNSEPLTLSQLDVAGMRPDRSLPLVPGPGHTTVKRAMHYNEPELHLNHGLELDDGVLFVNGDLKVEGGVRGHGALLVNGNVELSGGAELSAQNQVAIVADGDVIVHGGGPGSLFQGLIYSGGDLQAEDITLFGAFLANGEGGSGSRLVMRNANVVHNPLYTSFETKMKEVRFSLSGGTAENGFFRDQYELRMEVTQEEWEDFKSWVDATGNRPQEIVERQQRQIMEKLEEFNIQVLPRTGSIGSPPLGTGPDNSPEQALAAAFIGAFSYPEPLHIRGGEPKEFEEFESVFRFDLNEILNEADRTRVIHWREQ